MAGLLWPKLGGRWFSAVETRLKALAAHKLIAALALALVPVALRLALFPSMPAPVPYVHDDFGYLLVADTLLHGRFANPPLKTPEFFESIYVIQSPAYSSAYPVGVGASLAIGRLLFAHPWGGVLLFVALMCAGVYWMLLGWVSPGWALLGGALTVMNWGVLSEWANCYFGGAAGAVAGCLIFGALPRTMKKSRARYALVLGLGLSYAFLVRPFETVLIVPLLVAFVLLHRGAVAEIRISKTLLLVGAGIVPGLLVTALHNHAATGDWLELPYALSRQQYGVPQTFAFQPAAVPRRSLTPEQEAVYRWQKNAHDSLASFSGWIRQIPPRLAVMPLFIGSALLPILFVLPFCRFERNLGWIVASIAFVTLGTSFYGFFLPQHVAPFIGLYLLLGIAAMQRLSELKWGRTALRLFLTFTVVHFGALYALSAVRSLAPSASHLSGHAAAVTSTGRSRIFDQLQKMGGRHLVFVKYGDHHSFYDEWVYNGADIAASRVVWARDLGPARDARLEADYPGRAVWRVDVGRNSANLIRLK